MTSVLRILILFGLIVWGFLLAEKHMPSIAPQFSGFFKDSNTSERCQQYGQQEEGIKSLSYGDRVKQVVTGCW